jgi:hypothetical protein
MENKLNGSDRSFLTWNFRFNVMYEHICATVSSNKIISGWMDNFFFQMVLRHMCNFHLFDINYLNRIQWIIMYKVSNLLVSMEIELKISVLNYINLSISFSSPFRFYHIRKGNIWIKANWILHFLDRHTV